MIKRVYLDLCCYNRPYDIQESIVIRLEAEAKLFIQKLIREGQLELVWSSMLSYENNNNPSKEIRERIVEWKQLAVISINMNDIIQTKAAYLMTLGIKNNDAVHIASAIEARADYFITTDKRILNKVVKEIVLISPLTFLERYEK